MIGGATRMRYVSVGRRFVAILIDTVISAAWYVPLGRTTTTNGAFHYEVQGGRAALAALLTLAYFVVLEALGGWTIGKLVVGIRVVREDGSRLDPVSALVRNVLRLVDAFPYVIPYLVGAVATWNTPMRQRIGDRAAHSVVIEAGTNRAISAPGPAAAPWPAASPAPPPPPAPGAPPPPPPPPPG